jgi:hypothetical protein
VTISDTDLEGRLRDLGVRADELPPAPLDLVQRVRERHRAQRRRELGLAAAGVAAVLVLVGVPVLNSTLSANGDRSSTAAPLPAARPTTLAEVPTRGSLAGDEDWLRGVRQLSWRTLSEQYQLSAEEAARVPDPPVDDRAVAFAGDVPGGRVALVLGRTGRPSSAWFRGPAGARPDQMALATLPAESQAGQPAALEYTPDRVSASATATLVLVGWPGDQIDLLTSRTVSADGHVTEHWAPVRMQDGVGAVALEWREGPRAAPEMRVHRAGRPTEAFHPDMALVDMPQSADPSPVDVADPKGLRSTVTDENLRSAIDAMTSYYVARPEDLHPTLLAGGPVAGDPEKSSALVGFTFPSGATAAALVTGQAGRNENGGGTYSITMTDVAPAGTPLLDRIFAVATLDSVTVSGPASGVLAELYGANGTLLAQIPLTAGAGSAGAPSAGAPSGGAPSAASSSAPEFVLSGGTVRIIDAHGNLIIQSALTGVVR